MRIRTMQGVDMKRSKAIRQIMLWSLASAVASALIVMGVQTLWASASDAPRLEVLFSQQLPDIDGREMLLIELEYPPGAATKPHRHPSHTVVYVTAYEVALKINEAAYPVTTAFQLEQYLHGPFCATTEGCVVTFIAPPGPGYERALELVRANQETGANVIALVQERDGEIASIADHAVFLPEVPEFLTPVLYLVPLYLFTYWLALEMGHNPDTFRRHEPRHAAAFQHAWV